MTHVPPAVESTSPVTLVGGGPVGPKAFDLALARAARVVAADGGADTVLQAGHEPEVVIGDFDSISAAARAALPGRLWHDPDQDSTDFEKCLRRIVAPLILAVGFAGGRMDHLLAVMNVLVRYPRQRVIVVGPEDLCVLAPPKIRLDLPLGSPVSLFPMAPVSAQSGGLHWPVAGLTFAPNGQSGTSNRAEGGPVTLEVAQPAMLLLLPLEALDPLITGLQAAPPWDATDFPGAARRQPGYSRT